MSPSPDHVKSLAGRIFTTVLVFSLGILLAFSAVMVSIFYYSYEHDAEQALVQEASRAATALDEAPAADVATVLSQQFSGIIRYTLISENGLVLYDSQADAGQMDNHASRPEVSKAARTGEAVSMRYSETLGTDTVYAAEKLSDGRIVRLSETRHSLFAFLGEMLVPTLFALVVVAGLVFLLSRLLTRHIMKPIDALDMAEPLENDIYGEMVPLLQRIDDQQTQLKKQNKELAEAFINFYLSYEVQNANALDGVDAPVRMDVVLTEDQVGSFVYGADEVAKLVLPDWSLIAEHQANWINSWNAIFSVK